VNTGYDHLETRGDYALLTMTAHGERWTQLTVLDARGKSRWVHMPVADLEALAGDLMRIVRAETGSTE
jgi:hypothetical protein